ncbi:MAG: RNA polymerase sigma factor [Clostridia bacterium]|nr:RNA polymerase sigma factor [Clostridia bacterium]
MTDREITALFRARDESAIGEAAKKYGKYCYAVAYRILGNDCDAEECVNDTWLAAWNKTKTETPDNLGAFLSRITHNVATVKLRDMHTEKRGGEEIPLVFEELESCIEGSTAPDDAIIEKELSDAVDRFLGQLSRRHRDIFIARYYSARSYGEIAAAFHTSETNVRMILSRVRKKLASYLKKEGFI